MLLVTHLGTTRTVCSMKKLEQRPSKRCQLCAMQYRKSLDVSANTLCAIRDDMVTQVSVLSINKECCKQLLGHACNCYCLNIADEHNTVWKGPVLVDDAA